MTGEYGAPPREHDPPPGGAPLPDDAPATVGQVRTLRRWVAVAGVWAVAATVVALIALIDADEEESAPRGGDAAAEQIGELERSVERRFSELEDEVRGAASGDDLERLNGRLQDLEDDVSSASESAAGAADAAEALGNRIDELRSRVEELEAAGGGGSGAGGDGGDAAP